MGKRLFYILKGLLGGLFILSAVLKFVSLEAFERYIYGFALFPFDCCSIIARLTVAIEWGIGLALLLNYRHRLVCRVTAAILSFFSLFLLYLVVIGEEGNCHCFGEVADFSPVESLIKNLALAVWLALIWRTPSEKELLPRRYVHILLGGMLLLPFLLSVPDGWVRSRETTHNLDEVRYRVLADSLQLSSGPRLVCLYSVNCSFCRATAQKVAIMAHRYHLSNADVMCLFMQTSTDMAPEIDDFFVRNGGKRFPFRIVPPLDFLSVSGGVMPIVLLTRDTLVEAEYDYRTLDEEAVAVFFEH